MTGAAGHYLRDEWSLRVGRIPARPARPGPEHPPLSQLLSAARPQRKAERCGMRRGVLKFL